MLSTLCENVFADVFVYFLVLKNALERLHSLSPENIFFEQVKNTLYVAPCSRELMFSVPPLLP